MTDKFEFTSQEKEEALALHSQIRQEVLPSLVEGDEEKMRKYLSSYIEQSQIHRDVFGLNPILLAFQTAALVVGLWRGGGLLYREHFSCPLFGKEEYLREGRKGFGYHKCA